MNDDIKIPMIVDGKVFYDTSLPVALKNCNDAGFSALFMPQIMDFRSVSDKDSPIWNNWCSAPSVRVTGTTKGGNNVVVYAHVPNYFSSPKNIANTISDGLINGAGLYPQKDFEKLLGMEDNENVFVVDYKTLKDSVSGVIKVSDAIKHPQVVPFIGGQERAQRYLLQHEKVVGKNIGVWHSDDLHNKAYGRVLFVGDSNDGGGLLNGYDDLDDDGRFVGVRRIAEGDGKRIVSPLEKLAGKGTDAGSGIIVLRQDQLTPAEYTMLTRK